jgi:hypothetical protein
LGGGVVERARRLSAAVSHVSVFERGVDVQVSGAVMMS